MSQPSFKTISLEIEDGIAIITLDRSEKLNAFTSEMALELIQVFDITDANDDVGAIIVTGSGDRAFCAGLDLSVGKDTFNLDKLYSVGKQSSSAAPRDEGGLVTLRIFNSLKPVIAAINGAAIGVGITMTLAMDIRLASEKAEFGFVFNQRGIVPESASSWFLPKLVGVQTALEWIYTSRIFGSNEALETGLIRSVHSPSTLLKDAKDLAHEIINNTAPVSTALSRQMVWRIASAEHPMEAHRLDSKINYSRGKSADAAEGVKSFIEKRAANYPCKVSDDMPDFFPWWDDPAYEE